jgi:hypothetical protein
MSVNQVSINRHLKMLLALVLAAAAVLIATQIGGHSVAADAGSQPASIANHQGNATPVPPILPPARSSDQPSQGVAFSVTPPAHGRYSNAEMNAYATVRR